MNGSAQTSGSRGPGPDRGPALLNALRRLGLLAPGETPNMAQLTGGVSSDIWRIDLETGPVCVKRALPRLKVAQIWEAPVERNANEAEWIRIVARRVPGCTPRLIAEDRSSGLFVMEYLRPDRTRVWKDVLRAGETDPGFAARVGATMARIHAATAGDVAIADRFGASDMFHALRLEPYFIATARRHPRLSTRLEALVERTAGVRLALVHGDVSPKNILIGASGPILLDAECAWYGDPAFDLAFCLNHLLLKTLWVPSAATGYLECYDALAVAYKELIDWEPPNTLEARAATLLPALLLARIDGKSPVEYVTDDHLKARVRAIAGNLLTRSGLDLAAIAGLWRQEAM